MSDEPKFCVACKHYRPGEAVDCVSPLNKKMDMVTGNEIVAMQARVARECDMIGCGSAGKWFVAKAEQEA